MQQRKLKVVFGFMPYGGNGNTSSEHPDIRNWLIPTLLKASQDPRIEPIFWVPEIDYKDVSDTPAPMVRNDLVGWARDIKADVLVMVDSDNSPDVMLGIDPEAKPFFETAFDHIYKHWDKGPCVVGAPYCGPPMNPSGFGTENIYVFLWRNAGSQDPTTGLRLDQYTREEAVMQTGISPVAALPTGVIMYDLRCFDHLPHPWFYYEYEEEGAACDSCEEYIPGPQRKKCSTEDVTNTRNLSMIIQEKLGYNPVFCNWDAWAGHWKPHCVGKPRVIRNDQVGAHFRKALQAPKSNVREMYVNAVDLPRHPDDAAGPTVIPGKKAEPIAGSDEQEKQSILRQLAGKEELKPDAHTPDAFKITHNTDEKDLQVLQEVVLEEARRKMLANEKLVIIELGSWTGASALAMANAVHLTADYEINCVDHWKGGNRIQRLAAEKFDAFKEFKKNVGDKLNVTIFPHRGETADVAARWKRSKKADILFIDADHSYEGCLADIENWKGFVRPGGIICGHDYANAFPGVKQAVHEAFGYKVWVEGSVWMIRVPELESKSNGYTNKTAVELVAGKGQGGERKHRVRRSSGGK